MSVRTVLLFVVVAFFILAVSAATPASPVNRLKAKAASALQPKEAWTKEETDDCYRRCGAEWRGCTWNNPAEGSADYVKCANESKQCNNICKRYDAAEQKKAAAAKAANKAAKANPWTKEEADDCYRRCGAEWRGCTWNNPPEGTPAYKACEKESLQCNNICKQYDPAQQAKNKFQLGAAAKQAAGNKPAAAIPLTKPKGLAWAYNKAGFDQCARECAQGWRATNGDAAAQAQADACYAACTKTFNAPPGALEAAA